MTRIRDSCNSATSNWPARCSSLMSTPTNSSWSSAITLSEAVGWPTSRTPTLGSATTRTSTCAAMCTRPTPSRRIPALAGSSYESSRARRMVSSHPRGARQAMATMWAASSSQTMGTRLARVAATLVAQEQGLHRGSRQHPRRPALQRACAAVESAVHRGSREALPTRGSARAPLARRPTSHCPSPGRTARSSSAVRDSCQRRAIESSMTGGNSMTFWERI